MEIKKLYFSDGDTTSYHRGKITKIKDKRTGLVGWFRQERGDAIYDFNPKCVDAIAYIKKKK